MFNDFPNKHCSFRNERIFLDGVIFPIGWKLFVQYIISLAHTYVTFPIYLFIFPATDADIIQLLAVHGNDEFNIYIIPGQKISAAASQVTQLTMVRGRLLHKGKPVLAEEPKQAFEKFLTWLKAKKEKVVLLAHNAKCFDSKRIIYALKMYDLLSSFHECVLGFIDTLA